MRKLRDAVLKRTKEKEIYVSGGADGRLRDWDRKLGKSDITPEEAIAKVKGEFKYNLSDDDYKEIEKEIK